MTSPASIFGKLISIVGGRQGMIGKVAHGVEEADSRGHTGRPSDVVMDVVGILRSRLSHSVLATKPYSAYYLCLSPVGEMRMPQWLSVYASQLWLPHLFEKPVWRTGPIWRAIESPCLSLPAPATTALPSGFPGPMLMAGDDAVSRCAMQSSDRIPKEAKL